MEKRTDKRSKPRGNYRDPIIAFFSNIDYTDSCWLWQGALDKDGYGHFTPYRKRKSSHRYSYEIMVDDIPEGLVIDHLCRVRNCVNPNHLEAVSSLTNILRGYGAAAINRRKAECINGHDLKGDNLYIQKKTNKRFCRACDRRRGAEYERRKRFKENSATKQSVA